MKKRKINRIWPIISVALMGIVIAAALVLIGDNAGDPFVQINTSKNTSNQSEETNVPTYEANDAINHIGEKAVVSGEIVSVFTSKKGVTFLDFCRAQKSCKFSAVIFASDLSKFGDVKQYERDVKITGIIRSYEGVAEIILNDPSQIE